MTRKKLRQLKRRLKPKTGAFPLVVLAQDDGTYKSAGAVYTAAEIDAMSGRPLVIIGVKDD